MHTFIETYYGIDVYRVPNDVNGNPRYLVWYPAFDNLEPKDPAMDFYTRMVTQEHNVKTALGGKSYRGQAFGGGVVFTSYYYRDNIDRALDIVI